MVRQNINNSGNDPIGYNHGNSKIESAKVGKFPTKNKLETLNTGIDSLEEYDEI